MSVNFKQLQKNHNNELLPRVIREKRKLKKIRVYKKEEIRREYEQ